MPILPMLAIYEKLYGFADHFQEVSRRWSLLVRRQI